MRPLTPALFAAACLSLYSVLRLPYAIGICFFIALTVLAFLSFRQTPRLLDVTGYAAFSGFLILSAIMGGYYADVKGVGGSILPELIVGGIGTFLLIFEAWQRSTRL